MEDFISIVRTDRKRELAFYKQLGYALVNDSQYILINKIIVYTHQKKYNIGVQVDGYEVYFYIIDDGANYYLSIYDIYKVLHQIAISNDDDFVIKSLKKQLSRRTKHKDTFSYKGVNYELSPIILPPTNGLVMLPGASKEIDYEHLFVLLSLIQEKSNAFFRRSKKSTDKKYKNGIIRLLIVLLSQQHDIPLLNELGWFWASDCFVFDRSQTQKIDERRERNKKKYYLTNEEYSSII